MKWSLGTIVVLGLVFCTITFLRNEDHNSSNGAPLVAQTSSKEASGNDPFAEPNSPAEKGSRKAAGSQDIFGEPGAEFVRGKQSKTEKKEIKTQTAEHIERKLDEQTLFDFQGVSLEEIADHIRELHKCEVQIDKRALEEASYDTATRFDKRVSGVRLRTALELLLEDHSLAYQVRDGVLLITSEAAANASLTRKVYPRTGTFAQIEARQVYSLLSSSISPASWVSNGGHGALNILPDRIIVSNNDKVHQQLADFWKQNESIASSSEIKNVNDTFTEADREIAASLPRR
jgi:hypothetical protein